MKKFLVVLSAMVCVLGLSMPSLAYTTLDASLQSYLTYNAASDFYVLNTEFKVSSLSSENLNLWKRFVDAYSGQSDDEYALFSAGSFFYCYVCSSGSSFYNNPSSSPNLPVAYISSSSGLSGCLIFSGSGDFYSSDIHSDSFLYSISNVFIVLKTSFASIPSQVKYVVNFEGKNLQISDDMGGFEPEEPDPPSSSSPVWIPPVVSDPVIPEGDEYVFYDTKILGLFLNHVRTQIVHAANVGWLIFGFILVWHVIKRVIKAFSSR